MINLTGKSFKNFPEIRHKNKDSAGETTKPIGNPVRHAGKYIVLTNSVKNLEKYCTSYQRILKGNQYTNHQMKIAVKNQIYPNITIHLSGQINRIVQNGSLTATIAHTPNIKRHEKTTDMQSN